MTDKRLLTPEELEEHFEWVDDGDGYNKRQEWNIKSLCEAQLAKAIPDREKIARILWNNAVYTYTFM